MCNVVVVECPERPCVAYRGGGGEVYYTKTTKAEKDYLKKCKEVRKTMENYLKGE